MLDSTLSEESLPNIQSELPLVQHETISSHPISCYLGEETDSHLSITSVEVVAETNNIPFESAFLQTKYPQLPQPLPMSPEVDV